MLFYGTAALKKTKLPFLISGISLQQNFNLLVGPVSPSIFETAVKIFTYNGLYVGGFTAVRHYLFP